MFLIGFKSKLKADQSETLTFRAESHFKDYVSYGLKHYYAKTSTQDLLRYHQMEVDVAVLFLDTLLIFPHGEIPLAIRVIRPLNHQRLTVLSSTEENTWLSPKARPVIIRATRVIQIPFLFFAEIIR